MKYLLLFIFISNQSFGQRSIDTDEIFTIGGLRQFVRIKGKDISKPLLLFLHGGPGSSLMQKADRITNRLQDHFIVVHWDQRETGETLRLNKTLQPLTLQLFYNDTHDLIDTLLRRFQQSKLYLAGYSWGSGLGFYIADKYPAMLYAYIAIGPVINQWESERLSLEMLKEQMGKKGSEELAQVKIPFENAEQLYYHRKWLYKYEGQKFVNLSLRKSFVLGWGVTWFDVWSKSCAINLFETLPALRCPVYFFAGAKDHNTSSFITREYFNRVQAPMKELFLFSNSGHGLPETHSAQFQDTIVNTILTQTFNH